MNETIHIHDDAASYALRTLPEAEKMAVEAHAAICPPCQKLLDEAREVAHMLALLAPSQQPPAWCKRGVMQRIEREAFLETSTRRPAPRSRPMMTWVPVVAVIALFALWNVQLQTDVVASRQAYTAIKATMQQNMVTEAMVVDAQASHALNPRSDVAQAAQAKMFMSHGQQSGVVIIRNLPAPPSGKVYRIWVAREGEKQACATFTMANNFHAVTIQAPQPLDTYKWIMVTLEDAKSSTEPSDQTIFFGDL